MALCGEAALGTITKSPSSLRIHSSSATNSVAKTRKIEVIDPETGEITSFDRSDSGDMVLVKPSFEEGRQARYSLHRAFKQVLPKHRTASCLWSVVSADKSVQVSLDLEANRARYNNLRVCGRVWPCPFCSAKISERRAGELAGAMVVAKSQGLKVALLTCTVPHVVQDALKTLLMGLLKAWRHLVDDRVGKAIRADLGLVGTIRNVEATCGCNGWHPHFHCLVFYKNEVDLSQIESRWSAHWQHVCVKAGLRRPSDEHGLTLQNGDYAAAYVSKWGLEHEMTKSMHKLGRKGGRTPFDILRDYQTGETSAEKEENAVLFREFVAAFHGVRQLAWSPGLKKLLAVVEISDEELALLEDKRPTRLICELDMLQWKAVRQYHRATLLTLAEKDAASIPEFLNTIKEQNMKLTLKFKKPVLPPVVDVPVPVVVPDVKVPIPMVKVKTKAKVKAKVPVSVVKAPRKKPVAQVDAAAKRLANQLINEEQHARRLAQVAKVQPLVDSYFSDKVILRETVVVDGVECLRPLVVGIGKIVLAWLRTQPETLGCSNILLNDLIGLVLKPHVLKPQYLAGILKFNERFDFSGNVVGEVSTKHKKHAEKFSKLVI